MTTAIADTQPEPRGTRGMPPLLPWVIVLGVLVRVVLAVALGDEATPVSGAADQYTYDALAQRVVAGHGFSFATDWYPFTRANEPTAHWSYLYTLYLSGVYALVGHHPLVARLIQAVLSGLNCWLTYRLGRQLFDRSVGLAAAALSAGYAYFIFFNAALMTQTFYIMALLAAFTLAIDVSQHPNRRAWVLLGMSLGVGTLLRQTLLLFAPILIGWIVWTRRPRWADVATAAAIVAALVLPWTIRNYRVFGDFLLLNSNGGFWFYSSNHPNQNSEFNPSYAAPLPSDLDGLAEPAVDRALYRRAVGFIVADPVRFVRLTVSRIPHYFWLLPSAQSSMVSNLGRVLSFTLYLPFMVYGLYLSRPGWRQCLPLYLYVGFDTTLHLISWAAPRYRLPSDALLMVFAGLALRALAIRVGVIPAALSPTPASAVQYPPRS
jgi:4-amino-4-deoxy-L-arabinose transferase-like glycosyltransferase